MEENLNVPDFIPVLSRGVHSTPSSGACVMEYVSMLAGEKFSDRPECTHPVLAALARTANDSLRDQDRHLLVPLIGRLFGTNTEGSSTLDTALLDVFRTVTSAENAVYDWYESVAFPISSVTGQFRLMEEYRARMGPLYLARLKRALDVYDEVTGRAEHKDFAEELQKVAANVG